MLLLPELRNWVFLELFQASFLKQPNFCSPVEEGREVCSVQRHGLTAARLRHGHLDVPQVLVAGFRVHGNRRVHLCV